jgi:hypothetical protein
MKKVLLVLPLAIAAILLGASRALACGTGNGYSYAGLASPSHAYGIGATVTPVGPFNILTGHVAGWVGVGGPGQGPHGADEWLQVGFSGFPSSTGSDLYYELTLPSRKPTYHQIASDLPVGRTTRFAVLEMHNRPSWWRVWVNGSPASQPIYMPGSHDRWAPIATAESWDDGTSGQCNGFLYRFDTVSIAHAPGGGWQPLGSSASAISSVSTRVRRSDTKGSFLAAEGDDALRMLASVSG